MIVLVSRIVVRPGSEKAVADAVRAMVEPSRREPGCVVYIGHQSVDDPRTFLFYEQWSDSQALEDHRASPHFREFVDGIIAPAAESRQRDILRVID